MASKLNARQEASQAIRDLPTFIRDMKTLMTHNMHLFALNDDRVNNIIDFMELFCADSIRADDALEHLIPMSDADHERAHECDVLATNGDSPPEPIRSKEQLDAELDEIIHTNRQQANEEFMLTRLLDLGLDNTEPMAKKRCRDYDEKEYETRDKRFRFDGPQMDDDSQ